MTKLLATIVPPTPAPEAEASFRRWCAEHPTFVEVATSETVVVTHIRSETSDGRPLAKRSYAVEIDSQQAHLLVAESDWILDVVVVEHTSGDEADALFREWVKARPAIAPLIESGSYEAKDVYQEATRPGRRYHVRIPQRLAALLAEG